jgi:cytochrome c oxidase cbb3-type subunit 3
MSKRRAMHAATLPVDSAWFKKVNAAKLTKTEPIENEMDILLDHDYDELKSLIIIYRHGGCTFFTQVLFLRSISSF